MTRLSNLLFALALLAGTCAAQTQTWFTLVPASAQSISTTAALPVGATYRFYTSLCIKTGGSASTSSTVTVATTISDFDDGLNGRPPDPCPGTAKELDVLEAAVVQTVTVNGVAKTVPAVVQPPPVVTTKHCTYPAGSFDATVPGDGSFTAPIAVVVTCK